MTKQELWESTTNTMQILKLSRADLNALRKHSVLKENIDYKKIYKKNNIHTYKYNLENSCYKIYALPLKTFTDPNFDYSAHVSRKFEEANARGGK
ncbi:MAG: hypothetical protein CM15mV46_720 [Caudoviricetes sp.]|nr:MAG: hypothetical protein CM15mV46_720 [Caudoviricetes sp.]|tara:strand:- start:168 stop:452 length:285 start_codon:yes stop_codon:yes gene_type:complete